MKVSFSTVREKHLALLICLTAFILRLGSALFWPSHFWAYTVYYDMASVLVHGGGYCLAPGISCAYFPPVYPTILAAGILTGHPHAAIALAGSLLGTGTVWLTWLIGRDLFAPAVGLPAASYAAIYPYFVWHDAVIQETATLAFATAGAVYLLLRSDRERSILIWLATGAALACTILTKANLLLFVPTALVWTGCFATGSRALRMRRFLWIALGALVTLGPWVVRTVRITDSPIFYSQGGEALWASNHALTFRHFPEESIDMTSEEEESLLSRDDQRELKSLRDPNGIQRSAWFWKRGVAFMEAHPGLTLRRALDKVWIAFSPRFSPAKSLAFQTVYFVFWMPLFVLSAAGAWFARKRRRELGYIYIAVATFALGTAILWGHTSHRMYLEPFLMILSASAALRLTTVANDTSSPTGESAVRNKESLAALADR